MIIEYDKNDEYVTWGEGTNWHEASLNDLIDAYMLKPIYCEECKKWDEKSSWCNKFSATMTRKGFCSRAERKGYANSDFTANDI